MNDRREELEGLLVQRSVEGLNTEESRRLEALLAEVGVEGQEWVDRLVGELDAATVEPTAAVLSPRLRKRIG